MGEEFSLTCTESGEFEIPEKMPYCRAPLNCPVPPIPGNETRLELSFSEDVKEWTKAHYKCKNGTKIPDDFDVANLVDGNFTVSCGSGGKYPVCINTILFILNLNEDFPFFCPVNEF